MTSPLHRAAHVGDLFGPLVDEQDHEVHLGVVGLDGVGDLLHDRRLAGLGGRDDQAALALADRREQVDDARRQVVLVARHLEVEPRVGEQRRQVLETGPVPRLLGVEARDRVDAQERRVLLVVRRRPAGALDVVAPAQGEPAGLADGDVDVLGRGQVAVAAQEAVALVAQVEHALHLDQLALVGLLLAAALQLPATLPAALAAAAPAAAPVAEVAVGLLVAPVLVALAVLVALVLVALVLAVPVALPLAVLAGCRVAGVGQLRGLDEDGRPGVCGGGRLGRGRGRRGGGLLRNGGGGRAAGLAVRGCGGAGGRVRVGGRGGGRAGRRAGLVPLPSRGRRRRWRRGRIPRSRRWRRGSGR